MNKFLGEKGERKKKDILRIFTISKNFFWGFF